MLLLVEPSRLAKKLKQLIKVVIKKGEIIYALALASAWSSSIYPIPCSTYLRDKYSIGAVT
ncbi:unnamed protein product [Debaryomyces fabryi]|nr:unnamed protein product [Debaryomyces fabryi]